MQKRRKSIKIKKEVDKMMRFLSERCFLKVANNGQKSSKEHKSANLFAIVCQLICQLKRVAWQCCKFLCSDKVLNFCLVQENEKASLRQLLANEKEQK